MKLGFVIGVILAFTQFCLSVFICKGVYIGEPDAGMAAGLYFNLFGYLPLGSLLAFFLPKYNFFPQIDFQNRTSLTSYAPSVLVATLNWFLVGFLVGLAFERHGSKLPIGKSPLKE
jgi:hypothetical protein